jgi:hypothetical protein
MDWDGKVGNNVESQKEYLTRGGVGGLCSFFGHPGFMPFS